jgi:hypothetical protein
MVSMALRLPHTETGGYRVGLSFWLAFQASYPFGELEITETELVLRTLIRCHHFPKEHIRKLSQFRGLFSRGLRIEHSLPSCPRFVVFWSRRAPQLLSTLAAAGFPVVSPKPSNQKMELTASRRTIRLYTSSIRECAAAHAFARGSSSCSR